MMNPKEYRAQLAESFTHVLEEKQLDWKKEWQAYGMAASPVNGRSGHVYRGINRFFLMFTAMERGYSDNRWCTFNQIKDQGWKLENAKGQGVKIEYWFPYDTKEKRSMTWEEYRKTKEAFGERYALRAVYKTVFNADLINGIPELIVPEPKEILPDDLLGTLSANMNVEVVNDGDDQAFYRPLEDKIHLPLPGYFESEYAYDSTALHEMAHATGAAHRLNRNMNGVFGSPEYAYEELIAEISACFMSAHLLVEQTKEHVENHKAYVQYWIKSIREKPETLIRAIQQAEKTAAYMEYKGGLIERKEYEKIMGASADVEQKHILMTMPGEAAEIKEKEQSDQRKTREELNGVMQDIEKDLDEIREDTRVLQAFAEKYEIPIPREKRHDADKEYYVIEDRETGKNLKNPDGEEIRTESREEADQMASKLNEETLMQHIAEQEKMGSSKNQKSEELALSPLRSR